MRQVFVTGAGRGIGRAIALKLSTEGFAVSGCARSAGELAETRSASGDRIRTACLDVTNEAAVASWIDTEIGTAGTVPWGLVTAAGIHGDIGPLVESNWEQWKAGIEVNLYGTALASKFFARQLLKRKLSGRIVMLSGGGATQPIENLSSYCASKAAVVRFGETLAQELKAHGITVNSVAPGAINTAITDTILSAGPEKAGRELYYKTRKQKETGGTSPDKAVALVSYLLSEKSAPVTGRLISAIWDAWPTLHEQARIVGSKDMYTLRRMVPEDQK